jgi:hypothetical protein
MAQYVITTVGTATGIDPVTGEKIFESKTLLNESIEFTATDTEIRGGSGNKLLSKVFYDSGMNVTLENATFDLQYLALTTGSKITVSGDALTTEQYTVAIANQLTVTDEPQNVLGYGKIGWYRKTDADEWIKVDFTGKTANIQNVPKDTVICVQYAHKDAGMKEFVINSNFIPSTISLVLTFPLFVASGSDLKSTSQKAGEVQIWINRYQINAGQSLSITSNGASTTSLSGSALASFTGTESCSEIDGIYGTFKQIITGAKMTDGLKSIAILNSDDISLNDTETYQLSTVGIYGNGIGSNVIPNDKLTYSVKEGISATVTSTGLVTAKSTAGTTTIEVGITGETGWSAVADIEVK